MCGLSQGVGRSQSRIIWRGGFAHGGRSLHGLQILSQLFRGSVPIFIPSMVFAGINRPALSVAALNAICKRGQQDTQAHVSLRDAARSLTGAVFFARTGGLRGPPQAGGPAAQAGSRTPQLTGNIV